MPYSSTYALDRMWPPLLKDLGVSSANVLRRAGLPDDLFAHHNVRLEPHDFYRLWEGLEKEIGDETFPIKVCDAIKPEFFSPPLFAALCSPNFLTAVERIARYKTLVAPMRIDIKTTKDVVSLDLIWLPAADHPPVSFVTMELLFFVYLARTGTCERIKPVKVTTPKPPQQIEPFTDYLGIKVQRGTSHLLSFSKADTLRPFMTASDDMWATFEPQLRRRLSELDASVSAKERVQSALLEALPSGIASVEAVSEKLAISKRSLQRQLAADGTTFVDVLQATREKLAKHYLAKSDLTISEIAFLLGFTEENSFYRAFRSWTMNTPDDFRQKAIKWKSTEENRLKTIAKL